MPSANAKMKSSTHTAYILSSNRDCQPNHTATIGTAKANHSASRTPIMHPAPQCSVPLPTIAANG